MQRCPYIHEMRERLLGPAQESVPLRTLEKERVVEEPQQKQLHHQPRQMAPPNNESNQVGTMIKLNPDGYGSHTSPTHQRTPLVPRDLGEDFSLDNDFSEPIDPRLPKNAKTSLFIITSLVYAMLLIVVCIAYVISDVSTHRLPIMYYEGFFTYLYGASILFLLYVFCFLLQESTCCNGGGQKVPKPVKEKKPKKQKPKKTDAATDGKDSGKGGKEVAAIPPAKPTPFQDATAEADQSTPKNIRKRKTTQNDPSYGSFFLRIGAIAFGLGTMIYVGLEFGSFFEIPFTSPCHQILRGVNPLLQMIFTFMQMYFIFMNSRLNIHRFKVLARFGLMHIAATNICVWIRTLVLESLKEITAYHQRRGPMPEDSAILESIRQHTLRNAGTVMGTELGPNSDWEPINMDMKDGSQNVLSRLVKSTVNAATEAVTAAANEIDHMGRTSSSSTSTSTTTTTTTTEIPSTTTTELPTTSILEKIRNIALLPSTVSTTLLDDEDDSGEDMHTTPSKVHKAVNGIFNIFDDTTTAATTTTTDSFYSNFFGGFNSGYNSLNQAVNNATNSASDSYENFDSLFPAGLTLASTSTPNATSCGRVNIMGTIVQDSAPYLYPFIIEYSLIGAVVIYVMWKHIGRYPKYTTEEDLEHRLEVMLSRRAVAMAQANNARVDCVGASKGLFFGLLLLVGSLICLILFFVLVRHPQLSLLAIYLADVSHCALMALSLIAIIIGFIRVQTLKFRCEEQGNLNDILLRISAFGLFTYSVFSVIAGSLNAFTSEPNLLVMITGILAVLQVVLQLLFIADVSRRRVHLPEHDRSKPGRQIVTFLLICNVSMFAIYTFEAQKVFANPVQLDFYGYIAWSIIQRVTLPLCIFHRFHSAVTLAEVWKTTYKPRLE